jgi:hypothetical protein
MKKQQLTSEDIAQLTAAYTAKGGQIRVCPTAAATAAEDIVYKYQGPGRRKRSAGTGEGAAVAEKPQPK